MSENTQVCSTVVKAEQGVFLACDAPRGWYAVYTAPRHEKRVAQHFAQRYIETFIPLYRSRRNWKDGSRKLPALPLFPGYIFARIAPENLLTMLQVPGVISVLCFGNKPARLPDAEVESLRTGLEMGCAEPHDPIEKGERVRILSGAFAGMEGFLERNDNNFRVVLRLERIAKSFVVQVDPHDLELLCESCCGTLRSI